LTALLAFEVAPADLKNLAPPAFLIFGERTIGFYTGIAVRCREIRPDIEMLTVAGAGHNSHREKPDIVNKALLDFLGRPFG
jgi:pimeloyl-ACP methyl ester carboxylesterase